MSNNLATDADARIIVYIDSNVWNFLFDNMIDLCEQLPPAEYKLCITREVEIEISPMPFDLKVFVEETVKRCHVEVKPYFGFFDDSHAADKQRFGGFGVGHFATKQEVDFINQQEAKREKIMRVKTGLSKHETDTVLGARSFKSVILTRDGKASLRAAGKLEGKVVLLKNFDKEKMSLSDFIKKHLS